MTDLEAAYDHVRAAGTDVHDHLPRFRALVEATHASHVIELGVRGGASTVAWLAGLERTGGRLWAVDLGDPPLDHPRMSFVRGSSVAAGTLARLPLWADVVFIDTDHTYELTLLELSLYAPLVARAGGCLVLHDTNVAAFPHHEAPGYQPQPDYPVAQAVDLWQHSLAPFQGFCVTQRDLYLDSNGLCVLWVEPWGYDGDMRIELTVNALEADKARDLPNLQSYDVGTGQCVFAYGAGDENPPRDYAGAVTRARDAVVDAGGAVIEQRPLDDAYIRPGTEYAEQADGPHIWNSREERSEYAEKTGARNPVDVQSEKAAAKADKDGDDKAAAKPAASATPQSSTEKDKASAKR
jgi:predicted O-methyltransferase YrrM